MDQTAVERYLHDHIPLSAAMGARVLSAIPEGVVLQAPLEPNLNHRDTDFGGSVAAMAVLAGWTLVHIRLRAEGMEARTVIQRSDVTYLHRWRRRSRPRRRRRIRRRGRGFSGRWSDGGGQGSRWRRR